MTKTPEEHAATCAERAIIDYHKEVIDKGKDINQLFIGCFMEGFITGRRLGLPDKLKFEQQLSKMKCLETANDLLKKSIQEIETHYLTRCVRFCQSFHMRVWWKYKDISSAFKNLLRAIWGRKKGYEPDYRSPLYRTLQAHLEDIANGKDS